ncbi:GNAT family N-acetyltransferase [Dendrosporobacter sp. 1207_IL3150]|uniref:GNAT family N-acetyltransferase n=1 Tax=Dendrosporobacter sp. 1207_IL3150 TaxID=3084054 RepID=UPI002FD8AA82
MNIRKATIADIDILIKLRLDYLIADSGNLSAAEEHAIRSQLTSYFTKHINHDFIAIVAEVDNNVLATAFLAIAEKPANLTSITGKTGTLLNVLTYPEYRRMGIASKVMSKIIDEAKQLGVCSLDLSATEDGKPLYEKLGFTQSSRYTAMKLRLI